MVTVGTEIATSLSLKADDVAQAHLLAGLSDERLARVMKNSTIAAIAYYHNNANDGELLEELATMFCVVGLALQAATFIRAEGVGNGSHN